jgi:hypothetical protein
MTNSRFKVCVSCHTKRAWSVERCPSCDKEEYETVVQEGEQLLEDAIGDSVTEQALFDTERRRVDLTEEDSRLSSIVKAIVEILPDKLINKSTSNIVTWLNDPVVDYLNPDEQPHFILQAGSGVRRATEEEVSTLQPAVEFGKTRVVITDERVLFLIGQSHGDVIKSIAHTDITDLDTEGGLLNTDISVQTDQVSYEIPDCTPTEEVKPVLAYIQAQSTGGNRDWHKNFEYEKGNTKSERFKSGLKDVEFSRVLDLASTGAGFGKRAGPKGVAVGFATGAGFAIWSELSQKKEGSVEVPPASDFAESVHAWQQAGAKTGDAKAEWISASVGAAISFAEHNSDRAIVQQLKALDPDAATKALQSSIAMTGAEDGLVPLSSDLDVDLEISNIRLPVSEISAITAELYEAGIFDELIAEAN